MNKSLHIAVQRMKSIFSSKLLVTTTLIIVTFSFSPSTFSQSIVKTRVNIAANWSASSTWIKLRTGSAAFTSGSVTVTGTGSLFTSELVAGDILMSDATPGTVLGTVASIASNTSLTLVTGATATVASSAYGKQAIPASTDIVQIGNAGIGGANGPAITLDISTTIGSLSFVALNQSYSLTHAGTNSLTISNNVTLNQPTGGVTNPWNINAGSASVGGSATFTGSSISTNRINKIAVTTGALSITGDLVYNQLAGSTSVMAVVDLSGGAGSLNIGGSIVLSGAATGTLTPGTASTVNFNGTGAQAIASASSITYNNFTINKASGTATLGGSGVISGNLFISQGILSSGNYDISVPGNWTNNGTFTAGTATVNLTGSLQSILGSASTTFNNLSINSSGTVTLGVNTPIAGNLTVSSGIFDLSTFTCNSSTAGGILSVSGIMKVGGITGGLTGSNFPSNFSTNTLTSSTINFTSNSVQTIAALAYTNLTSSGTGARTLSASANVQIAGTFIAGTNTYTITGTTVEFNGTTTSTIPALTVVSGGNYNNLMFTGSGTWTFGADMTIGGTMTTSGGNLILNGTTSARTVTITGDFVQNGGAIYMANTTGTTTINLAGNLNNTAGTMTQSGSPGTNGSIVFNGLATHTLTLASLTAYTSINYTVNNGSTLQLGSNVNLVQAATSAYAGAMTINTGATLNVPAGYSISMSGGSAGVNPTFTLATGGNLTTANAGGITGAISSTSMTRTISATANYIFNGSSGQNTGFVTTTANNVTSNVSGVLNLDASAAINGTLSIPAATLFTPAAAAILSGTGTISGSGTLRVTRLAATADFNSQYTISNKPVATFTIEYSGAGAQSINTLSYTNLTLSGSGDKTVASTLSVSGILNIGSGTALNMGTIALTTPLPAITGSGSIKTQNITATPLPVGLSWPVTIEYNNATAGQTIVAGTYTALTNTNTSNVNTAGGLVTVNGTLLLNPSSILDMSTYSLAGTITSVTGTGTLRTSSSSATAVPSGITYSGTVEYRNATGGQTIAGNTYNNLMLSNTSGTNTLGGNSIVNGTLTLNTSATLDLATYSLTGNFSMSGLGNIRTASISATPLPSGKSWTGSVEYYNATGGQTIVGGTYSTLLFTNTSGTNTASTALSVSGTLTIPSGTILDMSTYALTGSFTNAGAGSIKTQNTSTTAFPAGLTWTSTVYYNSGSAQTIVQGNYKDLDGTGGSRTLPNTILYIAGTFTPGAGVYTTTSSTLNFNGNSSQSIPAFAFNNVIFSGTGTSTAASGTINVAGTMNVSSGATLFVTGATVNLTGVFTPCMDVNAGGTLSQSGGTIYASGGTVNINGTFNQSGGTYLSTFNLVLNSSSVFNQSGTGLIHLATNTSTNPTDNLIMNVGSTVNQTGGTISVKDFQLLTSATATYTQNGANALLKIGRNFKATGGTFNSIQGKVNWTGVTAADGGAQYNLGSIHFDDVQFDGATTPGLSNDANVIFLVAGNWINNNSAVNLTSVVTTVTFNGNTQQTIGGTATTTFYHVTLASASSLGLSTDINVFGNWNNNGGTFSSISNTVKFTGTISTIGGTSSTTFPGLGFGDASVTTMNNNNSATSLVFDASANGISFTQSGSTILTVNGDATINQPTASRTTLWNISAGSATVSGNVNLSGSNTTNGLVSKIYLTTGTLTINGNLVYNNPISRANSGVIDLSGGAATLNIQGSMILTNTAGTLTPGLSSKVYYNGTGAQTVGMGSSINYYNLYINKASGTASLGASGTVINMFLNQGMLTGGVSNYTLTVSGNWANNGATLSTISTTFTGTSKTISGTGTSDFGLLTFNNKTLYTISSTNTCTGLTIPVAGNATSISQTSSGILTINGNVTLNQPSASVTTAWNINSGTATVNGNINLSGSNINTARKAKIVITTGTLNANGNIVYNSSASTAPCAVIDISGGAGILNLTGSLTLTNGTGTLTPGTSSTVNFNGTSAQSVSFASAITYNNIYSNNPATVTVSGAVASTSVTGDIRIQSGIFNNGGFSIDMATGKTFQVVNGAKFQIAGTSSMVTGTSIVKSFGATSTVEYTGTNQAVTAETYGHLTFTSSSGAVVKTMPAISFIVSGNFTSSLGSGTSVSYTAASNISFNGTVNIGTGTTFNGGSFTHTVLGSWTNNGTFTGSTGAVTMSGSSTTISGTGTHNFNDLSITAAGITSALAALNVSGNLSTTSPGTFTHVSGAVTMSGTTKTISGTGITLNDLTISGTVSASADYSLTGNLTANSGGSLSSTAGKTIMSGASKTISAVGSISLYGLSITGSVTTSTNFTISNLLLVTGTLTATAGTASFTSTSTLNGTANLFNVTVNGTSLQLATNSVLGIAGSYTVSAGILNVTSTAPNTVNYNGSAAQTIVAGTYHNLTFSNGNTKTAGGDIVTNGKWTIAASTTFTGSSFAKTLYGDFINNGTYTAGTGSISFTGAADAIISGNATTFNAININKSSANNVLTLQTNVSAGTVNMTLGTVSTGSNTLTITTTRTGAGIILGTITRTHAFTTGVSYEFEGQNNTINFASVSAVTSITVNVTKGTISDFPFGGSVNRQYTVTIPSGTYNATLRLHYEDVELNGNNETTMNLWKYSGSWANVGMTGHNSTSNYVEQSGLTSMATRWSFSDDNNVVTWNGSISSNWATPGNWTAAQGSPTLPPSSNDIVQIGFSGYTNQPIISTSATAKTITLGSVTPVTLTLNTGGSLVVSGNVNGSWSSNATHTINTNGQNLTINGDVALSDGTTNHTVNVNIGTGTVTVTGSLSQNNGANIIFSGAGTLNIGNNFTYTGGSFTCGTGMVIYNGSTGQLVAGVTYNNLTINKTGIASLYNAATINGNLNISSGELDINGTTTVGGNVTIASGSTLNGGSVITSVGGNWSNSGTFTPSSSTITFNGSSNQSVSATPFNNLTINKSSGTAVLGNLAIAGNIALQSGTLDLSAFTANRSSVGGSFTMANGTGLLLSGASNFPSNYATYAIGATSTVTYYGNGVQTIAGVTYGHLILSNGGANAKSLAGATTVNGDLTINSGVTFNAGSYILNLGGNWSNSGTFIPATGEIELNGATKIITGNTTFNRINVYGSYTVSGTNVTYNSTFVVQPGGSFDAGSGIATLNGDLTNNGSLSTSGTTTFTGTSVQNITLNTPITSTLAGIVNFNGTVSPVLTASAATNFATVNINNTGGITPATDWNIYVALNVSAGTTFTGGNYTHTLYSTLSNNGTITSSGTINFAPGSAKTYTLGSTFTSTGTVIFGGSGTITETGTPGGLNNVAINNSVGVTSSNNLSMTGNFLLNANSIFNAGSYSYTVGGNIISSGTLNGGTSSFTMSGSSAQLAGSLNTTFYDLLLTGNITANADFNVARNFTNNGTFNGINGIVNMTGSTGATISGTASPFNLDGLTINKSAGVIVTLAHDIAAVSTLILTSGNFDASSYAITQDPVAGGTLTAAANTTYRIGGTSSLPTMTSYSLDPLSTVEYYGTTQTVSAATNYGHLAISAAGSKTAAAALTIVNNFTLTNGTFVGGAFTHNVGGNWSMTSGAFTNAGTSINFNGTANQTISSTGAFNSIIMNKASGTTTALTDITVTNLTFTLGILTTASNKVIIPSGGAISGTAQATGWVYGNLQKYVTTTTPSFEIGCMFSYTPLTLSLASLTTSGNLVAAASQAYHPQIATSGLTRSINRFWTISKPGTGGVVFTTAAISFNWVSTDNYTPINSLNEKIALYSSSSWTLPTVTGTPAVTNIQGTGISILGDFAIGETCDLSTGFSYPGTPYCINAGSATITLNSGATAVGFSATPNGLSFNTSTGSVSLASSAAKTYTVTNSGTGTGGCVSTSTATIVVTAVPSATISYSGSPYCSNGGSGTVTQNGTSGGTYTSTAGLSINSTTGAVNLSASIAGTYTVTYTVSGTGCGTYTFTTAINITAAPSATISYTGSPYCTNGGTASVTFSGTGGGSYSSTAGLGINSSTGAITLGSSIAGTYSVTYTVSSANGCATYTSAASITITAAPSATISYAGSPFCSSASTGVVTLSGTTGGTYSSTPGLAINATTGTINISASNVGTYTVVYTVTAANGCSIYTASGNVTINQAPSATISYAGSPYCSNGGTASVSFSGTAGGTYSSAAGLAINAITGVINLFASIPGIYNVYYTIAASGGCSIYTASTTISINSAPSATISYAGTPYCGGNGIAAITLSGTNNGTYSSTGGLALNATTGAVDLSLTTAGTYVVTYTVAATSGCGQYQTTTTISVNTANQWTGAVSTLWNATGNWACGVVPTSVSSVTILSGLTNYPVISDTQQVSNLTILSGASLTISVGTLRITGTISNNGTFSASNGTVELNGISGQTIPANTFASNNIYGLIINNSTTVTLGGSLNLSGLLSLNNGQFITAGYLVLKSSANTSALVGPVLSAATNPITGNVVVERYIQGRRKYRLVTSSVTTSAASSLIAGQEALSIWGNWQNQGINTTPNVGSLITGGTTADGFDQQTANASLFTYNDATRKFVGFTSANGKNTKYTPLKAGVPYYMFVYGDRRNSVTTSTPNPTVLTESGTLLTGTQSYDTTTSIPLSPVIGRYTMLGNPFACMFDWVTTNKVNVSNTVWGWDANLSAAGGYVTVTSSGNTTIVAPLSNLVKVSRYVQPGQAFFVKTIATNPQFQISETNKITDTSKISNTIFSSATPTPLMAINLIYNNGASNILADGSVAAFGSAYSNNVTDEDASKLVGSNESLAIQKDTNLLSIEARQMPLNNDTMFLNISKLTKPQYTLQVFTQAMDNAVVHPFLVDTYLGTTQSLSVTDTNNIVFTVNNTIPASFDVNRFKIVFKQAGVLPVSFTAISAEVINKDVRVKWSVAGENDIVRYDVEHSTDGIHFSKIGEVAARGTIAMQQYLWLDHHPETGMNFYRIRSVQHYGNFILSRIVQVRLALPVAEVKVYPSPVVGQEVNLKFSQLQSGNYHIELYNWQGQQVMERMVNHRGGTSVYTIILPKLAAGAYVLKVIGATTFIQKVLIQ